MLTVQTLRTFFIIVIALLNGRSFAQALSIVVLYGDDWRHDELGVAGHPVIKTPKLDRLADQGVRLTQNYVTTAICGVSHASVNTGQ